MLGRVKEGKFYIDQVPNDQYFPQRDGSVIFATYFKDPNDINDAIQLIEEEYSTVLQMLEASAKFVQFVNKSRSISIDDYINAANELAEGSSKLTSERAILTFPDGWYWVPVSDEECSLEGAMMQHCGIAQG